MNVEQYKKRFYKLMESTMGDVKPLIMEEQLNPSFVSGSLETFSWNDATINQIPKWNGFYGITYFSDLGINKIINHYDGKQSDSQRGEPKFTSKEQLLFVFNVVKFASKTGTVNFTISKDGKVLATSQDFNFGGGNERSDMVHQIKVFCNFPKPLQGKYVINNSLDPQYYLEIITQQK